MKTIFILGFAVLMVTCLAYAAQQDWDNSMTRQRLDQISQLSVGSTNIPKQTEQPSIPKIDNLVNDQELIKRLGKSKLEVVRTSKEASKTSSSALRVEKTTVKNNGALRQSVALGAAALNKIPGGQVLNNKGLGSTKYESWGRTNQVSGPAGLTTTVADFSIKQRSTQ